ncbi:MAG: hypothetical protein QW589_00515 [Candidatus Bathyarchaeia archaeon]
MLKGGKATKRSRYGVVSKNIKERTLKSAELCKKADLSLHVIDSEWKWNYLLSYEIKELISYSKGLTTVLTFSTRHINSLRLIRQSLDSIQNFEEFALNLVVGNKAYLNWREVRRPAIRTLIDAIKFVKKRYNNLKIFIGTEGIMKSATQLALEYDLIPFLLFDKNLEENISTIHEDFKNKKIALYVPFFISKNYPRMLNDILDRLAGYILRRKWVQEGLKKIGYDPSLETIKLIIQDKRPLSPEFTKGKLGSFLKEATTKLVMYGDMDEVVGRIKSFMKNGIDIIVGLPVKENEEQIISFGTCIKKALD